MFVLSICFPTLHLPHVLSNVDIKVPGITLLFTTALRNGYLFYVTG